MSYVTQDTIWPDAVTLDSKVKDIIDLFYQLADDTSPEAGPRMAEEVFTDSARMVAGTGTFEGSAGEQDLVLNLTDAAPLIRDMH